MVLEQSNDPVSAKWDSDNNRWNVGEKRKYRWCNSKNTPESDWFYDISDALEWIKRYDIDKGSK
jgi:hypothetical protein